MNHGFFEPDVRKKVDYVSAQFDGWKELFRSADHLLETLADVAGATKESPFNQVITQKRRECDDERRALESTFDTAILQLENGANVEDTPPMTGHLPCNFRALTKLPFQGAGIPPLLQTKQPSGPTNSAPTVAQLPNLLNNVVPFGFPHPGGDASASTTFARPASVSCSTSHPATSSLSFDLTDRSHSSFGMIGEQLSRADESHTAESASSISYAAIVQRPQSVPPPVQAPAVAMQQQPSMEIIYQKLRDAVKSPDHYNLLENSLTTKYFIVRPLSAVDVLASIYHSAWSACSPLGNQRLSEAFDHAHRARSSVYIFFSLAGTEEFCGVAHMMSNVQRLSEDTNVWIPSHARQFSPKSRFYVEWLYVKDLAFARFKIRDHALTTEGRPALILDTPDGTEIVSSTENRLIGRRLVHSYHDLCSQGAGLLQDRARFSKLWSQLRNYVGTITLGSGITSSSKLTTVDDVVSNDEDAAHCVGLAEWRVETGAYLSPTSPFPVDSRPPSSDGANIRYFICRPAVAQDVVASVERSVWSAGTVGGHGRLHKAFVNLRDKSHTAGHVYLFFAVWNTDRFCGVAEMVSPVNFNSVPTWLPSFPGRRPEINGEFHVKWLHVGDMPFSAFSNRQFSLSSCKGAHTDLRASRDCDELLSATDGACLLAAFNNAHSAKSSLPKTTTLPDDYSIQILPMSTPPPSPLDAVRHEIDQLTLSQLSSNSGSRPSSTNLSQGDSGDHSRATALYSKAHMSVSATTAASKPVSKRHDGPAVAGTRGSSKSESAAAGTFVCGVCFSRGSARPNHLACGHTHHETCYSEWVKRNAPATCPTCLKKPNRKLLNIFGPRF